MIINKHHMIGKCKKEEYNISDPRNITRLEVVRHNGLHALFHTLNTPHEQFEYINGLWKPIQSKIVRELVNEINNIEIDEWYEKGIVLNIK